MECVTPQRATRRQQKPKLGLETLRISPHAHESTSAAVDLTSIYRQHLRKVLAPEYVEYAFALPDDCGSIWSLLLSDMESLGSGKEAFTQNEANLLTFLCQFFSRELIQIAADNLLALGDSYYGLDYTFGRPMTSIGKSIVDGIREEAAEYNTPLAVFLGQVSKLGTYEEQEDGDDWQIVSRRRAKRNNQVMPSQGHQNGGSSGGGGATGGGGVAGGGGNSTGAGESGGQGASTSGTGGSGDDGHDGGHFLSIEENTIEVHLPAFVTPPRGDPERKLKVRDRSLLFKEKVKGSCGRLYDAAYSEHGFVSLFHGTRTSSLESFQLVGISPSAEGSEFCRMPAFYTTNSVLHAFERPLHYKLGRCVGDFISVLEFRVDVAVLHGKRAPPGDSRPFDVRWFPRPSEDWKGFCIGNMAVDPRLRALAPLHAHDIVIGPVCKPLDGGTDMGVVTDRLGRGDVYLCQIAFCSPRAWSWLEGCFKRVYQERRDADAA